MKQKNLNEIYVVVLSSGFYDDYCASNHFATFDFEVAKAWIEKYNRILVKWQKYYTGIHDIEDEPEEQDDSPYWNTLNRYYDIYDRHLASIETVKFI